MKTSVIMNRKMGNFDVFQRTKDGMFNGNLLLNQWNKSTNGVKRRKISEFLESPKTKEFIEAICSELNTDNIDLPLNQVVSTIKGKTSSKILKTTNYENTIL